MSLISSMIQSSAAKKAARAQEKGAKEAAALQKQQYEQTRGDLMPFQNAGKGGLATYQDSIGLNGAAGNASAISKFQAGPGYQFAMDQGTEALNRSAAANGSLSSGGAKKELLMFGQGIANQEFGGWQNRLAGLAEMGQNAAAQTGSFGANAALAQGDLITQAANARAAGTIGSANALANGIGGIANLAAFGAGGGGGGKSAFTNLKTFFGLG